MNNNKQWPALLLLVVALLSVGCTRHVSRGLTDEGAVSEAVFPDESKLVKKNGSVPKPENLRLLGEGMTKAQLRGLVGSPHFREGYAAREWDYLFQLLGADNQMVACRFKVVFDKHSLTRSLFWAPAACAQLAAAVPAPAAPAPAVSERLFSVSTDALFPHGKWSVRDMSASGRERLQKIAGELRNAKRLTVELSGYADRTGGNAANLALSQRRAEAVREVLVGAGVPAEVIKARGMGENTSVDCSDRLGHEAKLACMAPDRRVEIVSQGQI